MRGGERRRRLDDLRVAHEDVETPEWVEDATHPGVVAERRADGALQPDDEVLVALGRRRQALETDVVGAAITGEDDHLGVVLAPSVTGLLNV